MNRFEFITSKGNIKEQTRKALQARFAADYKAAKLEDKLRDIEKHTNELRSMTADRIVMDTMPIDASPSVRWEDVATRRYNVMDRAVERIADEMARPTRHNLDYRGLSRSTIA